MAEPLLSVSGLSKRFGGVVAADAVSLEVATGSITALIGPNGAGKTTLFALMTGFQTPDAGGVRFDGADVTGLAPEVIARRGMVRTFQVMQPFATQSVRENIAVGSHMRIASRREALAHAASIAARVGLADRLDQPAAALTVAGRKRLEVARALATEPKLILFDEVLAGLNPSEIRDVVPLIQAVREAGVTIVLIEHVMQAVMSLAEHAFVLSGGRLIAQGAPSAVVADRAVIEAYLGRGMAARMAGGAA